jgi:4-carboxymuconolactone decarboxylase
MPDASDKNLTTPADGSGATSDAAARRANMRLTPAAAAFLDAYAPWGPSLGGTDPEFCERFANFCFDEVIAATPDLGLRRRALGWISCLLGCQGIDEYYELLPVALNMGLTPVEVKEVVYQASAYLGIGRVSPFLDVTNSVFDELEIELPLAGQATNEPTYQSRVSTGNGAQVRIFGDGMLGYQDKGNPDYPQINRFLAANCFGDWYTRGGLDLADRELVTFCFIYAQGGCEPQLKAHTQGCLNMGVTRKELLDVVSSNVPFVGYPRSLNAIAVVDEVCGG